MPRNQIGLLGEIMKTRLFLALVVTMALPAFSIGQNYQIQQPFRAYQANYSPAPVGVPYQQTAPMPAAQSPAPVPAPHSTATSANLCDSTGCDVGGPAFAACDAGGQAYMGCGLDGGSVGMGCGLDGGMMDCGDMGCGTGCGTYFSFFGGYTEMDPQNSTGFERDLLIDFDEGYAVGLAVGRRIGRNLRSELEYTFRAQTASAVNFNGNNVGNVGGFQNSHAGMLNFTYDLVFGQGNFVPYLGGGIGVASIDSNVRYGTGVASLDGDDSSVAYQWMAGLSYRARPNMETFVEYRFFEIDDPKINRFGGPALGTMANPNVLLNSEYISNDILFGLRFNY
ncbi:MAG: outer membrane beta-barrel protein [Planctomycetota bacterium]